MKKYSLIAFLFISVNAICQENDSIIYRCPPCHSPCDTIVFDKKGTCHVCNMPLYPTYKGLSNTHNMHNNAAFSSRSVAILLFPGVQIIDFTGPWEVFGQAGMNVFTVAANTNTLKTAMGMQVTPDYSFENMPRADIILVPGGDVDHHDKRIIDWLHRADKQSVLTMSVCNGSYFLGAAGLLDGREATTFAALIPGLKETAPKAKVISTKRFTHDGKIVTSAGLSSGIDAALHVVSEELGMGRTQQIATNLEYNWDASGKYVRANLADKYLIGLGSILGQFEPRTILYTGDESQWRYHVQISTKLSKEKMQKLIGFQILDALNGKPTGGNSYSFQSETGKTWRLNSKIDGQPDDKMLIQLELTASSL